MSEPADGPNPLLDQLRLHPEWTDAEREAAFQQLIEKFSSEDLLKAALTRLDHLDGDDAEAVLRIIEAYGSTEHFQMLATELGRQKNLPLERAWEALAILDYVGLLDEYPALADQWDEIAEGLDESESLTQLVEQIEADADGPYIALQGLNAVETEVRVEIVESLGDVVGGPGLVEFLRLLTFALEPGTRAAALRSLEGQDEDDPCVIEAWTSIATEHDDPAVVTHSRNWLIDRKRLRSAGLPARPAPPSLVRSAVTAIDGEGRATIVLAAVEAPSGRWTGAAFLCDLERGIRDIVGHVGHDSESANALFAEFADPSQRSVVEGKESLALGLLASVLAITGPESTPALRFWVERTAGPAFRGSKTGVLDLFGDWDPRNIPFTEIPGRSEAVLSACPDWIDRSDLTKEIAVEIALRSPGSDPDPRRDAGAYRYLFEHRLLKRLGLFQRMLYWMAAFWHAEGREDLGRSAQALAWQLADPQHAVPSHPFLQALTTRSLIARLGE